MTTHPRRYGCSAAFVCLLCFLAISLSCASRSTAGSTENQDVFQVVQLCDTQLGFGGYEADLLRFQSAVEQINALKPDLVFICGDLVNEANDTSYRDFKSVMGRFQVPCYCAAGNHDVGNLPTVETLETYRQTMGSDYYSVDHKGIAFVVLNSQLWKSPVEGETEAQDRWLEATLGNASRNSNPVVVVMHFPLFTESPSEPEHYFNLPLAARNKLIQLFKAHGVVAVLTGHTHRHITLQFDNITQVSGETTSRNFDDRPYGFRVWTVRGLGPFEHRFVPLNQ